MAGAPAAEKPAKGRLADNIVHFARALRKAGVPVGTLMSRVSRARAWLREFEDGGTAQGDGPALKLVGGRDADRP